jgi:hypothetical protein
MRIKIKRKPLPKDGEKRRFLNFALYPIEINDGVLTFLEFYWDYKIYWSKYDCWYFYRMSNFETNLLINN